MNGKKIDKERNKIRKQQVKQIMPLIGTLLDAWEDLPNDVKYIEELDRVRRHMELILYALEGE